MSKSNSKKLKNSVQSLNLDLAKELTIKFVDGEPSLINDFSTSSLFKVYLKAQLENKAINLHTKNEITFLGSKVTYEVLSYVSKEEEMTDKETSFTVNNETQIKVDTTNVAVDLLSKELENNLTLENTKVDNNFTELSEENKNILKEIIEKKIQISKEIAVTEIDIINYELIYEKLVKILDFHLGLSSTPDDALLNKEKKMNYMYKGVILNGIHGIGKTQIINYIKVKYLKEKHITYFDIDVYKDLQDKEKGLKYMKAVFKFAKMLRPSVVIFENLDVVFKKSEDENGNVDSELTPMISLLLREIDDLPEKIFFLCSSTNISKVMPEILKNGRFDFSISLSLPNYFERKKLFEFYSKDFKNNLTEADIESLSDKSHGFVPGDIVKLFKEAFLSLMLENKDTITKEVIESNLKDVKPINLKDIIIDVPKVLWSEIGGNKEIIKQIRQSVEWPLKNPDAFKRLGITPPNGTLLYGPPGCSKTMIAKALATEAGLNFFAVKGPELFSKYVGDTEKAVRDVFKKARMSAPSIIFFDEIDSMATQRGHESGVEDKVLCQLLNEMDGIEGRGKVVIFGATNRPDTLDTALIRPGRFDRLIYIPPPDEVSREEIFRIVFSKMKIGPDVDIHELSQITPLFSGADIAKVAREAGMIALNEDINAECIKKEHIIKSIQSTKPIITQEMVNEFEQFAKKKNE